MFVTVFEHSAFYNMTLINHHPDTAPVLPIKFRYLDRFVASISTCTATLRQCLLLHNYKVTANLLSICIVTRHSYTPGNLYQDSKNRAMASLHRDSFLAKESGPCPDATSANTNAPYCRAVSFNNFCDSTVIPTFLSSLSGIFSNQLCLLIRHRPLIRL